MAATLKNARSYLLLGSGAVLLALAILVLIATYQHNAAVAGELEEARAAANQAEVDRQELLAEIQSRADDARGSYVPPVLMLIVGAGALLAGVRTYRSNGPAETQ